jgi:chemotaxis protein methyltransferase CheR
VVATGAILQKPELTERQFERISKLVGQLCGINLHSGKQELVKARLNKRLRWLGLDDFDDYMDYVRNDSTGNELTAMIDALCTNLTRFFREHEHFDYLANTILPRVADDADRSDRKLRIWSAGCSTGEEAYSIALTVAEHLPHLPTWDVGILATDLSSGATQTSARGVYDKQRVSSVPPQWRAKYFDIIQTRPERLYQANDELRHMMHFAKLNLMDPWPMQGKFDAIFCRNVMIYFNKDTQAELIGRFWQMLAPGGTLFIGHSESLAGVKHRFRYVQPTVYERV